MERSPWSSLAISLPIQDLSPSKEQVAYQAAHHMHFTLDNALPSAVFYLKIDPRVCLSRIQRRQRPNHVSSAYLQQLHDQHGQEVELFPGRPHHHH